jgi:hypothetical protein
MKQDTHPLQRNLKILLLAVIATFLLTSNVHAISAKKTQAIENKSHLCTDQTERLEKLEKIPTHLLTAISLAETGRWHKDIKEIITWPWTITANGKGQHFDSKEEALAEIEILLTKGLRNIDVGCMQINLKYHKNAFESLTLALDPKTNTEYAVTFLKKLYERKRNWMHAVGAYHSTTLNENLKYRAKLIRLWNKVRRSATAQKVSIEKFKHKLHPSARIDYQRISLLNKSFQERRNADPVATIKKNKSIEKTIKRHAELDAWREQKTQGLGMEHLVAMRRAEQSLRQRKERLSRGKPKFGDRRKDQLAQWRKTSLWDSN